MKPLYNLLFIAFVLLFSTHVIANEVIVKGYIKSTNGSPVVNQKVKVSVDAYTNSQCKDEKEVVTNSNGFYTATVKCSNTIVKVKIATLNCNGVVLFENPHVPPSGIVEKNFSICQTPPTNCEAAFRFDKSNTNPFLFHFNSSTSRGTTAADNIVKRRWRFGDGSVLEGNEVNPAHKYAGKGVYEVCLTIITAAGCEKTTCHKIVIEQNTACQPEFNFTSSAANYKEIKFNSAPSTTSTGDNIISRQWHFGDGKSATTIDPVHVYDRDGSYRVCLVIKTAQGCVKEICKTIEIKGKKCEAAFVYEHLANTASISGYSIRFNSSKSTSNDNIVSRTWTFGDGTTGNTVDPLHKYEKPGLYNVCLTIKTQNGCESKECKQVQVGPSTVNCTPKITFDRISPKKIKFNSNTSIVAGGDQIISRSWFFGDGTSITTGNQVSVEKEYNRPGNYTVCLYIKTANGCENKVCIPFKIEETSSTLSDERIKIVTIYPAPVQTQMTTEVWSLHNNINATLAIYDIYGVKKWEEKKVLVQGTNVNVIATGFLLPGPYLFKVTTMYGVKSRQFHKM